MVADLSRGAGEAGSPARAPTRRRGISGGMRQHPANNHR